MKRKLILEIVNCKEIFNFKYCFRRGENFETFFFFSGGCCEKRVVTDLVISLRRLSANA